MRLNRLALAKYALPNGKAEVLIFDQDLPGFGLRVRAGGKRTWIAQYRVGAKQRRITLGTTETLNLDEARRRAREALAKVSLGADPQTEKRAAKEQASITMSLVIPRYLTYASRRQTSAYHADAKRYITRHWAPLSEMALKQIDRSMIAARLMEIAQENGPHAANRARATLSAFYAWAMGEGVASTNPVIGTNKATEEVRRDRVLTDAELVMVWRLCYRGDFGAIVRLLILTGQRRQEVGGMLWSELHGDTWTIAAERAKNASAHDVPLSPVALAVIAGRQARAGRDFVFGTASGPFQGWSNAKESLDKMMLADLRAADGDRAKLSPWRLHDIRRTVATRMGDLGVLPHVIEMVLNHVSGHKAGVAGIYNRSTYKAEKRAALELWASYVALLVENAT